MKDFVKLIGAALRLGDEAFLPVIDRIVEADAERLEAHRRAAKKRNDALRSIGEEPDDDEIAQETAEEVTD